MKTIGKVIFFLLVGLFPCALAFGQLNGAYTIGGTSPDYSSIQAAIWDLESQGVSGPVTFNIRPGYYEGHLILHHIDGANETSSVVFKSESGLKEDVVIHHYNINSTTTWNYTIYFSNANFITFRDVTLRADHNYADFSNGRRVVYISNQSHNIVFENCNIQSFRTNTIEPSNLAQNSVVYVGNDFNVDSNFYNNNITFSGCDIVGGYYALYCDGQDGSGAIASNIQIINNTISDFDDQGIRVKSFSGAKCIGNYVDLEISPIHGTIDYGILLESIEDSMEVNQNFVYGHKRCRGIAVSGFESNNLSKGSIVNNAISLTKDGLYNGTIGMRISGADSVIIEHNSILIGPGMLSSGIVFETTSNSKIELLNNHFVNYDNGICVKSSSGSEIVSSDHNNYFNGGTGALANINAVPASTISQMITNYGSDNNSTESNPLFMNNFYLIPLNVTSYNTGFNYGNSNTDYYGTVRSLSTPDIGYFEGEPANTDAAFYFSDLSSPLLPMCSGDSVAVYAKIANYGINDLTSVNIVLKTVDSTYCDYSWSGSLAQGNISDSILIGYISFTSFDSISFIGYTMLPNGGPDELNTNDTSKFNFKIPMSGIYTIGDSADDFDSLYQAVDALANFGICGPVTLNIDPGVYQEQIIIPFIQGTSSFNTITFQSSTQDSTDVVITYPPTSAKNYVIKLDGAKHITLQYLTIKPAGTSYNTGVYAVNGSGNNVFTHLIFKDTVQNYYSGSGNRNLIHFQSNSLFKGIDSNIISHNHFIGGKIEIYLEGYDQYPATENRIEHNYFHGPSSSLVLIENHANFNFNYNTVDGYSSSNGFTADHCTGDSIVLYRNWFQNTELGIKLNYVVGTPQSPVKIYNNFLSCKGGSLGLTASDYVDVYHNSLNNSETSDYGFNSSGDYVNFYYNIVYGEQEGRMINLNDADTSLFHSDYNLFYSKSTDPFYADEGEKYFKTATTELNLSTWQNLGLDINSKYGDPIFLSSSDLHINNGLYANNAALPNAEIPTDFDLETRSVSIPDIGADEHGIDLSQVYDIEIIGLHYPDTLLCFSNDSVAIRITNNSIFAVDSFTLRWWIYETLRDSVVIYQTIAPGDTIVIQVGEYDFNYNTLYKLDFDIDMPNGHFDHDFNNNKLRYYYYYLDDFEIKRVGDPICQTGYELFLPNFPKHNWLWSTGTIGSISIFVNSPGTYSIEVFHENGCSVTDEIIIE